MIEGLPRIEDAKLSPAQTRVALLILRGHSNLECANQLFVTEKTIKFHASAIYYTCGVRSRSELIAKYLPAKLQEELKAAKALSEAERLEKERIFNEMTAELYARQNTLPRGTNGR